MGSSRQSVTVSPRSYSLRLQCLVLLWALLAGCSKPDPFTLEFPADQSLGRLALVEETDCFTCENGYQDLGEARGLRQIELPDERWFVSLRMPAEASRLIRHLEHPSLVRLGMLDLANSDVSDDDLAALASMRLRTLNLAHTRITGVGLAALKPHPVWSEVHLEGCDALRPAALRHFRGWQRASIFLDYPSGDPRRALAERAICDGQPGQTCPTQIRFN